ncbi:hypothetical protein [uncultured Massilia sp.]|uniref:hypothetical protein n=1 Tax=uncultured Massilia sp. TaxID=169973 RepID=UPI0025DD9605|nr:hypothetical protein [uncultured Massilia sp.]
MNPTRPILAATLAAALASLSTFALADEQAPAGGQTFIVDSLVKDPRSGVTIMRTGTVTQAPYSALAVTERLQLLADGNQIAERQSTMTYRDGAGRTRREVRDAKGETVVVTINDPVASANVVLHPQTRTATRIGDLSLAARAAAEKGRAAAAAAARVSTELARREGDMANVERRRFGDGSEAIIVKRVERGGETRVNVQDVRIQFPKVLANAVTIRDPQSTVVTLTNTMFADARWAAKATTKDLGTRDVGGVKAEGKLRSYEIPAGEIGNRNPIVVSDETWTSPELKVAVYTKHSDPRSGDTIFRLENIRREEPAPALFAVPAGYTVDEPLGQRKEKDKAK